MKRLVLGFAALMLGVCSAAAQGVSFEGKTITMIIGYSAGGGTDLSGRLIAPFLSKYLPGAPNVIVQNMPGADGITAANFFVQQVKPDGLTIMMGASTQADPLKYREPAAKYDPTKFSFIGGIGRGGSAVVINKDAEKRLHDKKQSPVIMGSPGGIPRSGMQSTAWGIEFLGWNAKWVTGYPGTSEIVLALERGEIDMSATSNISLINKLVESGKFKVLVQTGTLDQGRIVARTEFSTVPVFASLMEGRIKDDLQQKGFDYWYAIVTMDKWLALPPDTPAPIVEAYRAAFAKMYQDREFLERAQKMSEDFEIQFGPDVAKVVKTLGNTPREAVDYISVMLKKQGIGGG